MTTQDATREYVSDASALPVVNQRVQLLLFADADFDPAAEASTDQNSGEGSGEVDSRIPTRVEDVVYVTGKRAHYEVLLAAPRYEGDVEPPLPGHAMSIVWSTVRGVLELPVEFVDVQRVGEIVAAWRVQVTGAAVRVQRRNYVRVPLVTPIVLTVDDQAGAEGTAIEETTIEGGPVEGSTVDVSEGGLRCVLAQELAAETPVQVSFSFGDDHFDLEGRIVRAFPHTERPGYQGEARWDTAVRFINADLAADTLRKCIFAEQMRIRRETGR